MYTNIHATSVGVIISPMDLHLRSHSLLFCFFVYEPPYSWRLHFLFVFDFLFSTFCFLSFSDCPKGLSPFVLLNLAESLVL